MKKLMYLLFASVLLAIPVKADVFSDPALIAWYDAADLSATLNDGDMVTAWPNAGYGGSALDGYVGTPGLDMIFTATGGVSGHPAVQQDGVRYNLYLPFLGSIRGTPWTIFLISKGAGTSTQFGGFASGVPRLAIRNNDLSVGDTAISLSLAGQNGLRIARLSGQLDVWGRVEAWSNDTYRGSADTSSQRGLIQHSWNEWRYPAFDNRQGGNVSEVLAFNRALNTSEVIEVADYLTQKYGLDATYTGWQNPLLHTLTVETSTPDANLHVAPTAGDHLQFDGQTVTLSAPSVFTEWPNKYEFSHWTIDGAEPNTLVTTVVMDSDKTVTAHYVHSGTEEDFSYLVNYIPNLVAWYDALDLRATLGEGDPVTTWPNKVVGGADDAYVNAPGPNITFTRTGGYNSFPAVQNDGTEPKHNLRFPIMRDYLDGSPWTIFVVTKGVGTSTQFGGFGSGISRLHLRNNYLRVGDAEINPMLAQNGVKIVRLRGVSGDWGVLNAWVNDALQPEVNKDGLIAQFGFSYWGYPEFTGRPGGVSEVLVFNRALPFDQVNVVAYYLTQKYGIEAPGWTEPEDLLSTLTISTNPFGLAAITPDAGENDVLSGTTVPLTAVQRYVDCPYVFEFSSWTGDVADPMDPSTSILMDENKTVTANYVDVRECGDECHPISVFDFNEDCVVDFDDFIVFVSYWMDCTHPDCD